MVNIKDKKIAILGGCGHIGLPLCVSLAQAGFLVSGIDKNIEIIKKVENGEYPYLEIDGEQNLRSALNTGRLVFSHNLADVQGAYAIIICIGTPVDENLSPIPRIFEDIINL